MTSRIESVSAVMCMESWQRQRAGERAGKRNGWGTASGQSTLSFLHGKARPASRSLYFVIGDPAGGGPDGASLAHPRQLGCFRPDEVRRMRYAFLIILALTIGGCSGSSGTSEHAVPASTSPAVTPAPAGAAPAAGEAASSSRPEPPVAPAPPGDRLRPWHARGRAPGRSVGRLRRRDTRGAGDASAPEIPRGHGAGRNGSSRHARHGGRLRREPAGRRRARAACGARS